MDLIELALIANTAARILANKGDDRLPYSVRREHGHEVAPGLFTLYNTNTGQSKCVLWHEESGYVFKHYYASDKFPRGGEYIGEVEWDDLAVRYQVRLPYFHVFGEVCAQEYVQGEEHFCGDWSCAHARKVMKATGYHDAHVGNWKICQDEIVLFDFD